jgi:aldehyde dehydrogenase (NAD+)
MPPTTRSVNAIPSTSEKTITSIHSTVGSYFDSGATRPITARKESLNGLLQFLRENYDEISEALRLDLQKSHFEGQVTELEVVINEVQEALKEIHNWAATEEVSSPGALLPAYAQIRKEPRGRILIIGPFNYPLSCTVGPLISVLAGGNTGVIKPSELCPALSNLMKLKLPGYFPAGCVDVIEGEIPETTALIKLPWDLIFFTGSERVGKIVASAASNTLTP